MSSFAAPLFSVSPWIYVAVLAVVVAYFVYAYVLDSSSRRANKLYGNARNRVREMLGRDQRCIVHGNEVVSNEAMGPLGRKFTVDAATEFAMQQMIDDLGLQSSSQPQQPQSPEQYAPPPRTYEAAPPGANRDPRQQQQSPPAAPQPSGGLSKPPGDDLQSVYGAQLAGRFEGEATPGNVKSRGNVGGGVYSANL